MFEPTPVTSIVAFRVRASMERDIKREAKKRKLAISEEVRRRLKFYADCHTGGPEGPQGCASVPRPRMSPQKPHIPTSK